MNKKIITRSTLSLIFTALTIASAATMADGNHRSKISITNKTGSEITLFSHNGKDSTCSAAYSVPHKVYYVGTDGSKTAKCHGQGKSRCRITAYWTHHTEVKITDPDTASQKAVCYNVPKNASCWVGYTASTLTLNCDKSISVVN
ncbi:MAG: hypothetical protein HRU20_18870 [Pseudomonadales bacterium]|nr:hypothetical protein [Pseudomonadales bacterium]